MGRVRGRRWIEEHLGDAYVRRAHAEGARSRAAYKLEEIARRDRLLRPGAVVVDLGAAPGGWSQVAARWVGGHGRVVAVDLAEMAPLAGVTFVRGDIRNPRVVEAVERALGGRAPDLVISDMAPNLTGIEAVDRARAAELAELALEFALKHLKPRGNFLVKAFHGAGFETLRARMRECFREVAVRKPGASRSRSSEVYLLGRALKAAVCRPAADTERRNP